MAPNSLISFNGSVLLFWLLDLWYKILLSTGYYQQTEEKLLILVN